MREQDLEQPSRDLGEVVIEAFVDAAGQKGKTFEQALDEGVFPLLLGDPQLSGQPLMFFGEPVSLELEEVVLPLKILLAAHDPSFSETTLVQPVVENSVNRISVCAKSLTVVTILRKRRMLFLSK